MRSKTTRKAAADRARKVASVRALVVRGATDGEQQAAAAALQRLAAKPDQRPPQPNREPLTDRIIKAEAAPATGNRIRYDSDPAGFGLRTTAAGHKSFIFNYRVRRSGTERRITIGPWPSWSVAAARREAKRLRREVDLGNDPLGDIEAEREAETVADLIKRFEKEHLPVCRPGTQADYRIMLKKYIRPVLGNLKVREIEIDHIERLHRKITNAGHLVRANAVVRVCSMMFTLAVRWKMRDTNTNPCKGVKKNTEVGRDRYLKKDELPRLLVALAAYPKKETADIFRLLLFTGARRGEVMSMRWGDIDLAASTWTKPAASTKQKKKHEVPLSKVVVQLLTEISDRQSNSNRRPLPEFVFTGSGSTKHVVQIKRAWASICKSANIVDLHVHDLRHSFASQLVSTGHSLPMIGAMLGHSDPKTTSRYVHMFTDPMRDAAESVAAAITAAGPKAVRRVS